MNFRKILSMDFSFKKKFKVQKRRKLLKRLNNSESLTIDKLIKL